MSVLLADNVLRRIHHAERSGVSIEQLCKLYHICRATLLPQLQSWRIRHRLKGGVSRVEFNAALDKLLPKRRQRTNYLPCVPPKDVVEYSQHE